MSSEYYSSSAKRGSRTPCTCLCLCKGFQPLPLVGRSCVDWGQSTIYLPLYSPVYMNVVSAVFPMLCSWSLSGLIGCGSHWAWRIITKTRWLKLFNTARFWALRHDRTSHQISVDKDQTLNISASIGAFLLLLQTVICVVSYVAFFLGGPPYQPPFHPFPNLIYTVHKQFTWLETKCFFTVYNSSQLK